jgi:hypothetical protein
MTKTMTTQQVLNAISRERDRMDEAVRAMGAGASTVPVTAEGWTNVIKSQDRPPVDEWNARAVAHYRNLPLDRVKEELDRVVDALVVRVRSRTDEEMNKTDALPYAAPEPLWQQIANETFEHWPEHADDIMRAARRVA